MTRHKDLFYRAEGVIGNTPNMARNLLKNPYGEEQLEFWELIVNGGNEWKVEDMPGDCGHDFCLEGVTKYFATSFEYCGRTDCGCTYQMTVCLLDNDCELIQEFKSEPVTLDPESEDCSWRKVTHTFSNYGPGMRFITFEHGGNDTKFWEGWFGVRVTGSSVTVEV
ncbi:F-box only protein 2 isoform X5 [Betta splendens]|uniref:F-box only protein 2 isoform X5 n=1 Tax=Betta splendens TaxID=158456 RepID=A0A9W2XTD5_BETSP|nr:F-box only protein 2 isoform X5 [Betta splendens]